MAFADKQIACRDCGTNFVFTAGEQEFYANKGLMNEPTRCQSCRSARRAARARWSRTTVMSATATSPASAARRRGRCTRHPAPIVAQMTEVPFVPRGERPVYCSACYSKVKPPEEAAR